MGRRKQIDQRGSELLHSRRARKIRLRQDNLSDKPPERFNKTSMVLIAHHAQDQNDTARGMGSNRMGEVVGQDHGSSGIMRAIQ